MSLSKWRAAAAGLVLTLAMQASALAASGEARESSKEAPAKAEANRRKPLQRCDQLVDQAQLDCLQKARQQVLEARKKREAQGAKSGAPTADKAKGVTAGNAGEVPATK